ncbi:hypothetical protein RB2501_12182 [Robiginitalea biformata HTCC2501]|uniref:Uncharacterized protein n=1 Tax=Robiginitalea biformata (strain ATCC BAA-864 / DSM 15991 / KCTC 12146 / HTCC2501) TaxID=313596 RepID=A4CN43_ROBBH|nr:hypothetical protein RB2501_12182 [Robiginitalea biformata HTCC2501]
MVKRFTFQVHTKLKIRGDFQK